MGESDNASKKGGAKIHLTIPDQDLDDTVPTFEVPYPEDARKLDKLRKHPLVPIGAGVTAAVLMAGLMAFNRGSQVWSQRMMRARVFAQGATLVVIAHSVYTLRSDDSAVGQQDKARA